MKSVDIDTNEIAQHFENSADGTLKLDMLSWNSSAGDQYQSNNLMKLSILQSKYKFGLLPDNVPEV